MLHYFQADSPSTTTKGQVSKSRQGANMINDTSQASMISLALAIEIRETTRKKHPYIRHKRTAIFRVRPLRSPFRTHSLPNRDDKSLWSTHMLSVVELCRDSKMCIIAETRLFEDSNRKQRPRRRNLRCVSCKGRILMTSRHCAEPARIFSWTWVMRLFAWQTQV